MAGMGDEEEVPMVNAIRTTADAVVRIEDMPGSKLQEIAAKHKLNWTMLVLYPYEDAGALADLIGAAHEHAGEDRPEGIEGWSARRLMLSVEKAPEDMPTSYADGIPKEADDQTTASSSGSSSTSGGPDPSSKRTASET